MILKQKYIDTKPTELHFLFYQYLLISPSYYLAYKNLYLLENLPKSKQPYEYDLVYKLCQRAGDVFNIDFDTWWNTRGIKLLAPTNKQRTIPFRIDLTLTKEENLEKFLLFFDKLKDTPVQFDEPIQFMSSKIRIETLHNRFDLVHSKSFSRVNIGEDGPRLLPKVPYWRMATKSPYFLDHLSSYAAVQEINKDLEKNRKNKRQIAYLTMLYSKNIKEALYIAENAARGRFPCKDPIPKGPKFDFDLLLDLLTDNLIAEMNVFDETKPGYTAKFFKSNKKKLSRMKVFKKIEELAEIRAQQKLDDPDFY